MSGKKQNFFKYENVRIKSSKVAQNSNAGTIYLEADSILDGVGLSHRLHSFSNGFNRSKLNSSSLLVESMELPKSIELLSIFE